MYEILHCRFLMTVGVASGMDAAPDTLQEQYEEFIQMSQALLCGHSYMEVLDTFDSMVLEFDELLSREKKILTLS